MSLDRDKKWLKMAHILGKEWSKDPSTKCGAIIVGPDNEIRSTGYNGFPRGIADHLHRLNMRDIKYQYTVHAEMNAILNAARIGVSTKGCTLYVVADSFNEGIFWGPCGNCALGIIQAGIKRVVFPSGDPPDRWTTPAVGHFLEADVEVTTVDYDDK